MFEGLQSYCRILFQALEIDPARILSRAKRLPDFRRQLRNFQSQCDWAIEIEPKLGDASEEAGSLGEYFWQDLWVAREIQRLNPEKIVDVGSRIDGFIAHLACFREVDVIDIRELRHGIPGIRFHCVDLLELPDTWQGVADCVTCLHTIEHFGLGRYGDPLSVNAWEKGIEKLSLILKPEGTLFLSVPVGRQRIKFNSHRIFHPLTIVNHAKKMGLSLTRLAEWQPGPRPLNDLPPTDESLSIMGNRKYSLAVFEFRKLLFSEAEPVHGAV
jgi:SAM-dependent methyltransferase